MKYKNSIKGFILAAVMFTTQGCTALKSTKGIDYSKVDEDFRNTKVYQSIDEYEEKNKDYLSQDEKNLEKAIKIYEFLDGKGLSFLEGELNQYSYDYEKQLNKRTFKKIQDLYYRYEKTRDKKIEKVLSYYLNNSIKYIDINGLRIANDTLNRAILYKVAIAVNKSYEAEGEESYINTDNVEEMVNIDPVEESFGEKVISVKDENGEADFPYTAGNNHNIIYDSVDIYEETEELMDDNMRFKKKVKQIKTVLKQAGLVLVSKVKATVDNKLLTNKPRNARKTLIKNYK